MQPTSQVKYLVVTLQGDLFGELKEETKSWYWSIFQDQALCTKAI